MRMPQLTHSLLLLLLSLILLLLGCKERANEPKLVIATAANMQFAMEDLVATFTEQTGVSCEVVISSSGKLTAQIQAGAPFDVFVSADLKYPESLYEAGLTTGPPAVYAHGQLVLWSIKDDVQPQLNDLTDEKIKHIALANPKTAPYGQAAAEVLAAKQLKKSLEHKLVFGESIAQTNQFIISGAAQVGFTALAVVQSPMLKGRGRWTIIPTENYQAIQQGVVVLQSNGQAKAEAKAFADFLLSDPARKILDTFGYLTAFEATE